MSQNSLQNTQQARRSRKIGSRHIIALNAYSISRQRELQYAETLRERGIAFVHSPRVINLPGKLMSYRPDFYLPATDEYVEVIGTRQAYHARKYKIQRAQKYLRVLVVDPRGNPFPHPKVVKVPIVVTPRMHYPDRFCLECGKMITRWNLKGTGLCIKCAGKTRRGRPNNYYLEHPRKIARCIDCNKQLSSSAPYTATKRCKSCARKEGMRISPEKFEKFMRMSRLSHFKAKTHQKTAVQETRSDELF